MNGARGRERNLSLAEFRCVSGPLMAVETVPDYIGAQRYACEQSTCKFVFRPVLQLKILAGEYLSGSSRGVATGQRLSMQSLAGCPKLELVE